MHTGDHGVQRPKPTQDGSVEFALAQHNYMRYSPKSSNSLSSLLVYNLCLSKVMDRNLPGISDL